MELTSLLKKRKWKFRIFFSVLLFFGIASGYAFYAGQNVTEAKASSIEAPYSTLTMGPNSTLVPTQTAFKPTNMELPGLSNAQDLCYDEKNHEIIIADTGNKRVLVLNRDGSEKAKIGESGDLLEPYGVSFDETNYYVADRSSKTIKVFDRTSLSLAKTISRPTSTLFGTSSPFAPLKVNVNSKGIFVIGEGSTKGVIQLTLEGEFVGYIGANKTKTSFVSWLQSIFYSASQQESMNATPASPTNLAFSIQGLLYTVTKGDTSSAVKKLNTLGNIILTPSYSLASTTAAYVSASDIIYSVTSSGEVAVYDGFGNLLFLFGSHSDSADRYGYLTSPVALSVDEATGDIMVLDNGTSAIMTYSTTDFSEMVFKAVGYYSDGQYLEGKGLWEEILKKNESFILCYKALAAANMKLGNYDLALQQYKLAQDKSGYSSAFWDIRNDWIKNYLYIVFFALLGLAAIIIALVITYRRSTVLDTPAMGLSRIIKNTFAKQMTLGFKFLSSPSNAVYEIKYEKGASVLSATILFLWYIALQILSVILTGYLFSNTDYYSSNALEIVLFSTVPVLLLIFANYLVSNVTDGEGKLKDIYISVIYALSPYLIGALPIMLLSRILTYNEQFVYVILNVAMYAWSFALLFASLKEVHDFSFWKTVKNIVLTLVAFIIFLLCFYVLYMLVSQMVGYFSSVISEIKNNVIS